MAKKVCVKSRYGKVCVTSQVQRTLNEFSNNFTFSGTSVFVGEAKERVFVARKKQFKDKKKGSKRLSSRQQKTVRQDKLTVEGKLQSRVQSFLSSSNVSEMLG